MVEACNLVQWNLKNQQNTECIIFGGSTVTLRYGMPATFQDGIVYSLLHGEDDVELLVRVLEPLWPRLDAPVSVQHVQDAILGVADKNIWSRN